MSDNAEGRVATEPRPLSDRIEKRLEGAALPTGNLRGADLRGADLRGADLRGADLRGADLRGADLRGADLDGANLRSALLHGANLRDTLGWRATLVHRGGDPELTWLYEPEVSGARADDETRWPDPFSCIGKGIVYEGPAVLALDGQEITVPAADLMGIESKAFPPRGGGRIGRVEHVHATYAYVTIGAGGVTMLNGDWLLAANLRLLTGQLAWYGGEPWTIGEYDPAGSRLTLARGDIELTAPAVDLLSRDNLSRWWWHVPGAERETVD